MLSDPRVGMHRLLAQERKRVLSGPGLMSRSEELAALRAVEATATNSIAQDINVFHLFRAANELYT